MKRLLLIIEALVYIAAAGAIADIAIAAMPTSDPTPPVVIQSTSTSGTTVESLCVEGYLPDGSWFSCP